MEKEIVKWKTVSMSMPSDFPVSGKDLKEVLEDLFVFPLAVDESTATQYEAWVIANPKKDTNLGKLIEWSQKIHGIKIKGVIPDGFTEQATE